MIEASQPPIVTTEERNNKGTEDYRVTDSPLIATSVKDSIEEDVDDSSSVASSTDFILNMCPFSQRSSTSPEKRGGKDDTVEEVQVVGNKIYQDNDINSIARKSEAVNDINEQIIEKMSESSEDIISPAMTSFSSWSKLSSTSSSLSWSRPSTNDDAGEHCHTSNFDSDRDCTIPFDEHNNDKKHNVTPLPKTAVTENNREATTTKTTTATTAKAGTRKSGRTSIATTKKSLSNIRTTSTNCGDDEDNDDENDSDGDPFVDLSCFNGSKKRRKLAFLSDNDDESDGSDDTSGEYTSTSEYSTCNKYEGKRNKPMVMTNSNKGGNDIDETILSTNHKEEGRFRPGQYVWVNLVGKEIQHAEIHSIVDATAVIVKWPIAGTYEEIPIDVLEPMYDEIPIDALMFDHLINGAVVPSPYSRRIRKKTDMYAPISDDRRKVKQEEEVEEEEDDEEEEEDKEVEEEYLSDEGETDTTMKGAGVIIGSNSKSSQGKWNGELTEPSTKRHKTLEGSEQQNKSGREGRRTLGRGWTKGLLLSGKDVCWMSPDAQIKFSSWEAAQKFAKLRKKFNNNESLAWNEHLRVSAGVADPRFQLSAIHSNTRATNKTSAKISHGTLSFDTNGDSTDLKKDEYVDHLIGATIYVSDGKFMGKSGTLEERGFGGWCTISGIPKRIKINSCSIVNDGKIDLKAARAMQRFMPPVMTPSQMAKALASTDNSAITPIEAPNDFHEGQHVLVMDGKTEYHPIEAPNDFHEGQHVLVMDGKTEYQAVIVSIDSAKNNKRRMATVRWSTWKGWADEVEVKNIRPMFSFESFLDPPGQSTIKRDRIQTERLSIVPGSKTYDVTTVDSKRCTSHVSKRKSHEDPPGQSTIKRKRIQPDRLSVVSGSKSYVGTTIDSKQCSSPFTKMTSHERADNMNTCNVKNAMIVYTKLDRAMSARLGWANSRCRSRQFFDQVSKLKSFKMKHGHLNVRVRDKSVYKFCCNVRSARRGILSGKGSTRILTQERIAALDAIGFEWMLSPAASSSAVRNTCQPPEEFRRKRGRPTKARKEHRDFFDRVGDLKLFKVKHGHLNIDQMKNKSMYIFCDNVRTARRDIISGKGSIRLLTKERIAALDAIGFDWKLSPSSGQPRKRGRPSSGTTTTKARKERKRKEKVELDCGKENEYNSLWKHYMEQSVRENEELLGSDIQLRNKVAQCSLLRSKNDVFRKEVHKKIMILHKEGGRKVDILRILKLLKEADSGELPKPDLYKLMNEICGPQTVIDDEVEILDSLQSLDEQHMTSLAGDSQHPKDDFKLVDSDSVGGSSSMGRSCVRPNIVCKLAAKHNLPALDIAESPLGSKKVINPCHQYQEMETIVLTEDDDLDLNTVHQKSGDDKCTHKQTSSAINGRVDDGTNGQSESANDQHKHSNFVDLSQN